MKNIPFPNPHDADALNDYLDELAAGTQANPVGDVQATAAAMHALANQSLPSIPGAKSGVHTGGETMQTAAYSPPISNRTRRSRALTPKPSRLEPWLSGILVAGLLISMVGYAWWNGPGSSDDNNNLAWAPGTVSPIAETPPEWAKPVSSKECPKEGVNPNYDADNPDNTLYSQEDYDQVSVDRSYEIIGPADLQDGLAISERLRQVQACSLTATSVPWFTSRSEYERRTIAGRESLESIEVQRMDGSERISDWYKNQHGLAPGDMYVVQDPQNYALVGDESLNTSIKWDPENSVLFADGRVGIVPSLVSYDGLFEGFDPNSDGYPIIMTIFDYQDGQWLQDENLQICIGDCSATPSANPNATPAAKSPS